MVESLKKFTAVILKSVLSLMAFLTISFANAHVGDPGNISKSLPSKTYYNFSRSTFMIAGAMVYDSLKLNELGLSHKTFIYALKGMEKLVKKGLVVNSNIISIADFSQPSVNKRLYVIDLANFQVLFNCLVAHGQRSGKENAKLFSNRVSSYQSSLGFYVTSKTYQGSNGYSLKLTGLEKGFNDNAYRRAIVVHGADYVNENWIQTQGYIGRSQGCPAVPLELCQPLIDQIKDGSCLFIYSPNSLYLTKSRMIR